MVRELVFNYNELDRFINDKQKDPNRTDGDLTMLRDNFRDQLGFLLGNTNEYIIKINDSTGDISINGQVGLEDKFNTLPTGYEMSNKSRLYTQLQHSIERAKFNGIYDKIFKHIEQ